MPGQRPQHANSTYKVATVRCVHLLLPYHFLYRCVLHHLRLLLTSNHQVIFLALNLQLIGVIQLLQLFVVVIIRYCHLSLFLLLHILH